MDPSASRPEPSPRRLAFIALTVAVGYYLGARLGFVLRFPPATTSLIWPPNSILTAALLLSTPGRFWILLLAALPAHLLVEIQAGFPPLLIGSLFLTNCLEAVIAAGAVHRWSDAPARFDSLRRITAFVFGAVLLAPLVSSFPDAAVVHWLKGEPFDAVWRRRVFSNALSALTLVPALVLVVPHGATWLRRSTTRQRLIVAFLALGLVVMGWIVFAGYGRESAFLPGGPYTALPFLLPLLIVAAVRFGPVGASLSLLVTALLAIATALYGWTPLSGIPAEERVLALQVFLIVVGVPLLVLGALIEERRGIVKDLADRLRFEELLSQLSGAFLHSPSPEIGPAFTTWIERVGRFLEVDRATLWRRGYEPPELQVVTFWSRFPGEHPVPALKPSMFPETTRRILGEQPLIWPDIDALPEDLAPERELVRRTGARSLLALPLVTGQGVLGCLALVMIDRVRCWPDEVVQRCRLLADVFASALARQHAESGVRASEAVKSAVLASLASHVAVLDREGRIIAVNESWTRFAIDHGLDPRGAGVGVSYLEVCRRAAAEGVPEVQDSYEGIVEVLAGARADFGLEYRLHSGPEERWFHMTVVPLLRPEGGAVVSHTEVTERRRAEIAAQRSRQELAHTLRVSTIGELTTSLAHELNQPLAAIVANAQAARRTLGARPAEVRQILDDIIEEGKRAGEVIHRLRELLRKGETERAALDVNRLVEDVVKLVGNDVMLRGVTLREELAAETLTTRGDRVQLRQVILNLLMNALEALGEVDHDRRVVVRTEAAPGGMARVSIRDTGPGLRGDAVLVFRPFYTTKEKGMGMGLSIARSILEAHGGTISGRNNPDRGATFDFTLPLVSAGSPERTSPGH